MKNIKQADTCTIGSSVADVKVSVTFKAATGVFEVQQAGTILPPSPDGTVSIGKATTLPGSSILVKATINQVGPSTLFEVDYVLQGTNCGSLSVKDSFDTGDPDATVRETINFK
jgi:hypothetical protein